MSDLPDYDRKAMIKALRSVRSLDRFQAGGLADIPPSRVQATLATLIVDGLVFERLVDSVSRFSLTAAGKAAHQ